MADETKHAGGRPRKGSLEFRGKTWHARLTVTIEGALRKWFDLGTDNKAVARRKLAKLVAEIAKGNAPSIEAVADAATAPESMGDVITRIVTDQGREGLKTWADRLSRLQRYALPEITHLAPSAVRAHHIKSILEGAGETLSKQTVTHLRNDLSAVFGDLWRDEVIPENPVAKTRLPKKLRVDHRPRVQLNDREFAQFMACADVTEALHLKALSSRSFGGQRTSDLHAWDWSHFNLTTWETAKVYRPKTDGDVTQVAETELVELVLPEHLKTMLKAYGTTRSKPTSGPVFPVLAGERAGQKQGKRSHARELRAALWRAGVHRPLPGFDAALVDLRNLEAALAAERAKGSKGKVRDLQRWRLRALDVAQELDAVQSDCDRTRCADFHSFRRSFNTALAAAGLNVQQAMALAGHRSAATHMLYVDLVQRGPLSMPEAALPVLPRIGPKLAPTEAVANDDPADLPSDSSENRTRVTGVRGQCPNR